MMRQVLIAGIVSRAAKPGTSAPDSRVRGEEVVHRILLRYVILAKALLLLRFRLHQPDTETGTNSVTASRPRRRRSLESPAPYHSTSPKMPPVCTPRSFIGRGIAAVSRPLLHHLLVKAAGMW